MNPTPHYRQYRLHGDSARPDLELVRKLLVKLIAEQYRMVVVMDSQESADKLDRYLWVVAVTNFLPHACAKRTQQDVASVSPVWITWVDGPSAPNDPNVVIVMNRVPFNVEWLRQDVTDVVRICVDQELLNAELIEFQNTEARISVWGESADGTLTDISDSLAR